MQDQHLALPDYCVGCNRQFVPRRVIVPIELPPPTPDSRHKGSRGLVHGTGRVRVNGTIKPAPPVKTRVEIDQSDAPLYCSPECEQRDLEFSSGCSESTDSDDYVVMPSNNTKSASAKPAARNLSTPNTRSMDHLQTLYSMPPLPPPTTETYDELAPLTTKGAPKPLEFVSGVMMANRRIEAALPQPRKPGEPAGPVTPVPGWTDGSQAWRASTYSFAAPPRKLSDIADPNHAAYGSIIATPHRSASGGVVANVESSSPTATSYSSTSSRNSDMLSSFEDSFARRSSSRISLYSPSTSPASSISCSPPRKQVSDMLLVPDVLRQRAGSAPSSSSLDSLPQEHGPRRHSAGALPPHSFPGARARMRSPLAVQNTLEDDNLRCTSQVATSMPSHRQQKTQRPLIETRSWSYDNVRTYPVMPLPTIKETRIVNGIPTVVEVARTQKRLFTFADTVLSPSRSVSELSI
ncbi:hypothetical protein MIND_00839200 [Mycena indigotica]|uniref:Uncharacterized protein n=1 Tax=Mycena indigotica TaxID=2126181 RepID=A0A8H6SHD3_9AGAR|nr:uncharacterized protein MIND_00839200 [Mycena indigotica]KAF7298912.1 hypothetical protein MIND_00839200 [Mycena indigotica]